MPDININIIKISKKYIKKIEENRLKKEEREMQGKAKERGV